MDNVVTAGFIALTDCAPIVIAAELGFDKEFGIRLEPVRLSSWAAMRDHLAFGDLDCAHMLGGLTLAMHLGLGGLDTAVSVPLMLGRGGNAVTVSESLYAGACVLFEGTEMPSRAHSAKLLAPVVAKRKLTGEPPIRFAVVHGFSSHNYELRAWLAHGGIDPDNDIELDVVPPSKMVETLELGLIDGYCVGEPWSQLAVEKGIGRIVVTKADLYADSPEKVLAVRRDWASKNQESFTGLVAACMAAMRWTIDPENHDRLAEILSQASYLDTDQRVILNGLSNAPQLAPGLDRLPIDNYLAVGGERNIYPKASAMLWLYAQMRRWGQAGPELEADVSRIVDTDAFVRGRQAVEKDPWIKPEGVEAPLPFDGVAFDPDNIEKYWQSFPIGKFAGG